MNNIKITFLGTGTSHGVPMIGCDCPVCKSDNPKNNRWRSSIWVQYKDTSIVVDTATEFRLQALKYNIKKIDAVLYTHFHADHVHGIDELRRYNEMQKSAVKCYGNKLTIKGIKKQHDYINKVKKEGGGIPSLDLISVQNNFTVGDLEIIPIKLFHGKMPILGFRFLNIAYLTDCSSIPEESYGKLKDLDVLIINALRHRPHSTHFTLAQALEQSRKINAKKTYFTHICHDIEHEKENKSLLKNCELAYDGLEIDI
jgi:phosphoribosyl 1,2-cyclic phosphate phosphodiesterase